MVPRAVRAYSVTINEFHHMAIVAVVAVLASLSEHVELAKAAAAVAAAATASRRVSEMGRNNGTHSPVRELARGANGGSE